MHDDTAKEWNEFEDEPEEIEPETRSTDTTYTEADRQHLRNLDPLDAKTLFDTATQGLSPREADRVRYPLCRDAHFLQQKHRTFCPQPGPMDKYRARFHCESVSHVPNEFCSCTRRRREGSPAS